MFERKTPRIFGTGPAPGARLLVYGALAVFLMVLDGRFNIAGPFRSDISTVMFPLQWVVTKPVQVWQQARLYTQGLHQALVRTDEAEHRAIELAEQVNQMKYLENENQRLRGLLDLRARIPTRALSAEVVYEAPDLFTNRLVIDKGTRDGVKLGAPVLDSSGVIGQVVQAGFFTSEVRLVTDRDQSVPVMDLRTGLRMVAFGEATTDVSRGLELRYVPTGTDVRPGDEMVTSGIDGYYPPGIAVGRVTFVDSHAETPFLRIFAQPVAHIQSARYVMVLQPVGLQGQDQGDAGPPEAANAMSGSHKQSPAGEPGSSSAVHQSKPAEAGSAKRG